MIPSGLFTQIGMVILAVAVAFTYVEPTLADITALQKDIETYEIEREKVVSVNSQLANYVSQMENVSAEEVRRLYTYLPDTIDDIAVPRDLMIIAELADVEFVSASAEGGESQSRQRGEDSESSGSVPHTFTLDISGEYEQIKEFFRLVEQNEYPLEVHDVSFIPGGESDDPEMLSVAVQLVTYAHQNSLDGNQLKQ